ncbi:MAG: PQQ-dependent sugar dehydrogenase [Nitrospirota bacterium]
MTGLSRRGGPFGKAILIGLAAGLCFGAAEHSASALEEPPPAGAGPRPMIRLLPVVETGLSNPLFVTHAGDGSGRLFIVEQPGRIRIVRNGRLRERPFLDLTGRVRFGEERGLLGLAFHPAYVRNGRFVVNYTRAPDGATVIAEYRVSEDSDLALQTEKVLLVVPQPYPNHNGGMAEFGPDGYLYAGLGDGGAGGDPENRGQNRQELLGKILRIDVDRGTPYAIPPDNPFAAGGGRPEIFALGFRNPWRFSFDRATGALWVADVGQDDWEEVDLVRPGGNYGWRIMEGAHCFLPRTGCPTEGLVLPVAEYANRGSRCSIIGGYVYRGSRIKGLVGVYVYGDYCSGEIFGLRDGQPQVLLSSGLKISSFGQDQAGELYVVGHEGTVNRIAEASR